MKKTYIMVQTTITALDAPSKTVTKERKSYQIENQRESMMN